MTVALIPDAVPGLVDLAITSILDRDGQVFRFGGRLNQAWWVRREQGQGGHVRIDTFFVALKAELGNGID